MLKTLCFGTFDGIHDGHRAMLREAKALGSYLVAAIAPDTIVLKLKNYKPRYSQAERIQMLKNERLTDEVILADDSVGAWKIIKKIKPNIIALGYDQDELRASLEEFLDRGYPEIENEAGEWIKNPKRPTITILSAHKPDTHHSRLLHSP